MNDNLLFLATKAVKMLIEDFKDKLFSLEVEIFKFNVGSLTSETDIERISKKIEKNIKELIELGDNIFLSTTEVDSLAGLAITAKNAMADFKRSYACYIK
jgi:hypothetical protein